jgi:hypothetical protein
MKRARISQEGDVDLFTLLHHQPIRAVFFAPLDSFSLIALSQACRTGYTLAIPELRRRMEKRGSPLKGALRKFGTVEQRKSFLFSLYRGIVGEENSDSIDTEKNVRKAAHEFQLWYRAMRFNVKHMVNNDLLAEYCDGYQSGALEEFYLLASEYARPAMKNGLYSLDFGAFLDRKTHWTALDECVTRDYNSFPDPGLVAFVSGTGIFGRDWVSSWVCWGASGLWDLFLLVLNGKANLESPVHRMAPFPAVTSFEANQHLNHRPLGRWLKEFEDAIGADIVDLFSQAAKNAAISPQQ